jgi:hypothetical protein
MRVSECVFGLVKAHGHCDCCEAMHVCACLCALAHKAHGHCDWCETMHACFLSCVFLFLMKQFA